MKRFTFALTGAMAVMLMAPHAQAQCPLGALAGTWIFSVDGFQVPAFQFLSSAGRFVATVGTDRAGNPQGILTITQTSAINSSITRLETDTGRFQFSDDCLGGTLTFDTSSRPIQFDFFLVNSGEMVLVGTNNGDVVSGTARLATALTCPANPLSAIGGTWVFSVEDFDLVRAFPEITAAGRFVANGAVLNVLESAGVFGGNVRLEASSGRVSVNDDCSGGTLSFSVAGRVIQFDYFFASANRILLSSSTSGNIITGEARRLGSL